MRQSSALAEAHKQCNAQTNDTHMRGSDEKSPIVSKVVNHLSKPGAFFRRKTIATNGNKRVNQEFPMGEGITV